MEVVAWIVITKFGGRLEGGFVRDWIIRGKFFHPPGNPKDWIQGGEAQYRLPGLDRLKKELIPSDLDVQLRFKTFNLDRLLDELYKYNILP